MLDRTRSRLAPSSWLCVLLAGCGARMDAAPTDAGADAGQCTVTNDGAELSMTMPGGAQWSCSAPTQTASPVDVSATIVSTRADGFVVDTCPPNADCAGTLATVTVKAPGLDLARALPAGTFVRIRLVITQFFSCQRALHVTTLGSWGGEKNPFGAADVVLLDVIDGGAPADDAPFTLGRVPLGCVPAGTTGCGSPSPDDYAFTFTPNTPGAATLLVHMGETKPLPLGAEVPGTWAVRDLRSFQGEECDAYWDWSYWLAYQSPIK